MSVDYTEFDRQLYERELRGFLPHRILDAHVHVFDSGCVPPGFSFPPKSIYRKFGGHFTVAQCLEWMGTFLPGHAFHMNCFGHPSKEADGDASAEYCGRVADNRRFFAMTLVSPRDTIATVLRRLETHRLIGYKPYPNFVDGKKVNDITIHDMLPAVLMEAADRRGLAITLHIPRAERLADPVNQRQMIEICHRYPNTKIIFAHIGRAYYLRNVIGFLDGIAACPNAFIDTAMVNHEGVLEYAFRHFPRERILFGSDAPVALLRGKSVEINDQYAYLMGEDYEIGTSIHDRHHVIRFTTFLYEQCIGIQRAAERAALSREDVENIFFNNAHNLFRQIAQQNYGAP